MGDCGSLPSSVFGRKLTVKPFARVHCMASQIDALSPKMLQVCFLGLWYLMNETLAILDETFVMSDQASLRCKRSPRA